MKIPNLTRVAAALTALAIAAPALPCGLMQHEAAGTTPPPVVAQAPRSDAQAQPQKTQKAVKKTVRQAKPTTAVAKN